MLSIEKRICRRLMALLTASLIGVSGFGQQVQVPPNYGAPIGSTGAGMIPPTAPGAGAGLSPGIQPFDPYAMPTTPPPSLGFPAPTTPGYAAPPTGAAPPTWPAPGISAPTPYGAPAYPPPPGVAPYGAAPYGAAPYGAAPYGPPPYSGAPTGASPYAAPYAAPGTPATAPPGSTGLPLQRLFQDTGFTYAWLPGGTGNNMQINEFDISTSLYCPNFMGGAGPLRVKPGFAFDLLTGPSPPSVATMPPALYAAYVDFDWAPQFGPAFGADIDFRTGVYSDFSSVTTNSWRFMGTGLGVIRLSPTTSLKLGVTYLDRNNIKILPAGGILWQPNPQTRWDIYFPAPRLSCYLNTINNQQVWWYLGGEYGGGAWTYEREVNPDIGAADRVDINDIRVFVGIESQNLNRCHSFLELGYVFDRELYYVLVPAERTTLSSTLMLRTGIAF